MTIDRFTVVWMSNDLRWTIYHELGGHLNKDGFDDTLPVEDKWHLFRINDAYNPLLKFRPNLTDEETDAAYEADCKWVLVVPEEVRVPAHVRKAWDKVRTIGVAVCGRKCDDREALPNPWR